MRRCGGTALFMCLLMTAVVALLGMSGALVALQDERAGRNDRDRTLAFQAAEAALLDAQLDIEQPPDTVRGALFGIAAPRFPAECGSGDVLLGLCDGAADAAWQRTDFSDATAAGARTVAYGQFTGQRMQADHAFVADIVAEQALDAEVVEAPHVARDEKRGIRQRRRPGGPGRVGAHLVAFALRARRGRVDEQQAIVPLRGPHHDLELPQRAAARAPARCAAGHRAAPRPRAALPQCAAHA